MQFDLYDVCMQETVYPRRARPTFWGSGSSLASFPGSVLHVTESWAGPGNEARSGLQD